MKRLRPDRISLLLADVDGTLVRKDKTLTDRAVRAVRALEQRGIRFAVTSGRPPKGMAMLIEPLGISTPIAGFNGGLFVSPDLTIIEGHTLEPGHARRAASMIEEFGLDVWIYGEVDWFVRDRRAPHVEREQSTVKFLPQVVDRFPDQIFTSAIKIVGVSNDHDRVGQAEQMIASELGASASVSRSQPYYVDVTYPEANKGAVVHYLSRSLHIPVSEIVTIGDMPNDVLMFRQSGFAIAMGNANRDVRNQADAVTSSCEDEGFSNAIETYILD